MKLDLTTLAVEKLIVHEVQARPLSDKPAEPEFSEVDSPLDVGLRNYFRERITDSLMTAAYDVTLDPTSGSKVPPLVTNYLADGKEFVANSVALARHLYDCQTRVNPAGLLIVVAAALKGRRALVILKLEKEEGVRVEHTQVHKRRTFNIHHLKDLMLTAKTRVYKIGLFTLDDDKEVVGAVSDKQRGFISATEVADFFLRRFLGCQLVEAPDISTKRFFAATETFINENLDDPLKKARYSIALLAEMNGTAKAIRPRDFARRNFEVKDQQPYVEHLEASGGLAATVQKDVALIGGQISRLQLAFASGIAVTGPGASFEEHVKMSKLADGRTKVEISDKLDSAHGRK